MKYLVITLGILAGVAMLLLLGMPLHIFGYAINISAQDFAKEIVENNLPPETCYKLLRVDIGPRPPAMMFRRSCLYDVAQTLNDPIICKFLMPSGLDCVAGIWGKLIDKSNCHWYQDNSVRCFEGEQLIPRITVCNLNTKNLNDECKHRLAFKLKDTKVCESIENTILRSVCIVRINTWNEFPEVRSTIFFSMP